MVIKYETCRIAKVKEGKLDVLIDFINKNISNKGIIYRTKKNKRDSSKMDLRIFFVSKKELDNLIEVRIVFDTPMNILDYIKYGQQEETIRHSIMGKIILFTKDENKNYLLILLKKTRSKKIIAVINKLLKEKIIEFVNIDLPKSQQKHLTNFWASGIKDDHERNISASGSDLEEGSTYKSIKEKRGHIGAIKTKENKLNYGLSQEGLIWVIPVKDMDFNKFLSDILTILRKQNSLITI